MKVRCGSREKKETGGLLPFRRFGFFTSLDGTTQAVERSLAVKNMGSGPRETWAQIPAPLLPCGMTLGKALHLSKFGSSAIKRVLLESTTRGRP